LATARRREGGLPRNTPPATGACSRVLGFLANGFPRRRVGRPGPCCSTGARGPPAVVVLWGAWGLRFGGLGQKQIITGRRGAGRATQDILEGAWDVLRLARNGKAITVDQAACRLILLGVGLSGTVSASGPRQKPWLLYRQALIGGRLLFATCCYANGSGGWGVVPAAGPGIRGRARWAGD